MVTTSHSGDGGSELVIEPATVAGAVAVRGDVNRGNAGQLANALAALVPGADGSVTLDFSELDLDDGAAIAALVPALRSLRDRVSRLAIIGAPQMLGHNLYRVTLLAGAHQIQLIDMREDEPSVM